MSYRAVDTNILDTVNFDLDTFHIFVDKVNLIVDHLRNTVVTVSNTDAYQGNTTGNGYITGIFGGQTLVANNLRGGNVTNTGLLTITSAANVANTLTVQGTFTVNVGLSNVNSINVRGTANVAGNLNVVGNAAVNTDLTVTGNTNLNGVLNIENDYTIDVVANTNLGATLTPQIVYSFPKTSWGTAKVLLQSKRGANSQSYEAVLTHDGTNPHMAVYGVVSAPPTVNNGVMSVGSNTTHINILYAQTSANTAVKAAVHLVK